MLFQLLLSLATVAALPTWDGLNNRPDFMSILVPTITNIQVIGTMPLFGFLLVALKILQGEPGNLTFLPSAVQSPSLFSISQNQLWQYKNESTVYPVAVLNTTLNDAAFLQLVLGKQSRTSSVVSGGTWKWRGSMLQYWLGSSTNGGVFYSCPTGGQTVGLFTSVTPGPTPEGCQLVTMHSFSDMRRQ